MFAKPEQASSFPRAAWERRFRPLCGPCQPHSTQSVATSRSHTERGNEDPCAALGARRVAFTLVELLVVITIIGILAALITVAAIGALRTARQAAIKVEVDQISAGFDKYKDQAGSYPPNAVTDGTGPVDDNQALNDMRRHLKTAFSSSNESDNLARVLVGLPATGADAADFPSVLSGGMTAAEATVFWLRKFSKNPKYPISGPDGPSYLLPNGSGKPENRSLDPLDTGTWTHPFKVEQLGPRDPSDGYFYEDPMTSRRFIEYRVTINGTSQWRRINFWQYVPAHSQQPILYFDTSRNPAAVNSSGTVTGPYDPPARSDLYGGLALELHVHALKKRSESSASNVPIEFANKGKFQVLHCGIDDAWGADILDKTSAHDVANPASAASYLLFPDGPFAGDAADTVVNFITQSRLEDCAAIVGQCSSVGQCGNGPESGAWNEDRDVRCTCSTTKHGPPAAAPLASPRAVSL